MPSSEHMTIFWFRRDLRTHDNAGLAEALKEGRPVLPIFVFDPNILSQLEEKADARVSYIHHRVRALDAEFRKKGGGLQVFYQHPEQAFRYLLEAAPIASVHCCRDHEPYAIERDEGVKKVLESAAIPFLAHDDQNLVPPERIRKADGNPYRVFTPFRDRALRSLDRRELDPYDSEPSRDRTASPLFEGIPSLATLGFRTSSITLPIEKLEEDRIDHYETKRGRPVDSGTTRTGMQLRFGSISVRYLARMAWGRSDSLFNELLWRDFFQMILREFPHVANSAFKPEFDRIEWRNDEEAFEAWCTGRTGYPLVDAGMRELSATGYMHNRCRMVTASFLTKHLLIDRRWGEAWFARKLLDFDLASNNGNWQWAAGCGCDAAPYFRIFNPDRQKERFDPGEHYIRKWIPEIDSKAYPAPVIDHQYARERALNVYRNALSEK